MKVLANNCVSTIAVPNKTKLHTGHKVAYNPILNLFVTMNCDEGISVWNPITGKVIELTDLGADGCLDMVIARENHVAMSYSEGNHGGVVYVYSLENLSEDLERKPVLEIESSSLPSHPGMIALSPRNSLLIVDGMLDFGDVIYDIFVDWKKNDFFTMRFLTNEPPLSEEEGLAMGCLCCTPDYTVVQGVVDEEDDSWALLVYVNSPKVDQSKEDKEKSEENNKEEEKSEVEEREKNEEGRETEKNEEDEETEKNGEEKETEKNEEEEEKIVKSEDDIEMERHLIDHCILDGVEYKLLHVTEFVHDGQNLILADGDKILLLETLSNGSTAHLIASGLTSIRKGLGINHKGQLMVCDGCDSIKFFDYKCNPRSLQDLCRCCILETISSNYSENVKTLSLPETLSDYLLFKDLGY